MALKTKDKLLVEAEVLFSQKGFYGTSINDIAKQVNVSKQALLHHYPTKEKLYAAVLKMAAQNIMQMVEDGKKVSEIPQQQLLEIVKAMSAEDEVSLRTTRLIIRELIDNRERAEHANQWVMRPFLDALVTIVKEGQQQGCFKNRSPFAFVYQLIASVQYYLMSIPTLKKLYTENEFDVYHQDYRAQLFKMVS